MLVLIIKIMVIVVITTKIVDVVEDKRRSSLWVKFCTPLAWIFGEFFGMAFGLGFTGMRAADLSDPMAMIDPELSGKMFTIAAARIAAALAAVGLVYFYAWSMQEAPPQNDEA